jgi:membrane associated rhomboid family serine protease
MIQICAMSFLSGAFARKYYFDVPLVPHLSRDHQLWRLAAHHLAFANSSELLVAVILIYSLSPTLERTFGSHKYAVRATVPASSA